MPKVTFKNAKVYVDKKKISLISGEVHYWRLNPLAWKDILKTVKDMGLDVIATYVPWHYHEPVRGQFDFTGKTDETRNLKAFLELTKSMGFKVIIRPGPYIYSEWPNDGVPDYARKYHRLHPKFKEYAENYMRKVCKVIKPFMASNRGGHIILFQADNEIDPWPDIYGNQYGLQGKPGMFQEFLREKYANSIDHLNDNWGTTYGAFEEAGPFIACMLSGHRGIPLKGDPELKRSLDYFEFKYDYSYKLGKWCVDKYREIGIDIPIYLNLYPFFYVNDWGRMQEVADMVGIDLYPSSELAEDQHEQRKLIDKLRYTRAVMKMSYIAEFQAGIWHNRHYESGVLTPNHYRMLCLTAILGGVQGWNWYMLVNRDNWYMSPINEWGRVRGELYDVFKDMVSTFKKLDPATLERQSSVACTFNPLQHAARTINLDGSVIHRLYEADIDYELYDPRKMAVCNKKILFYSGNQWMGAQDQKRLLNYVEGGGVLAAFLNFPRKDESFKPCNVVGFHDPSRTLFEFKKPFTLTFSKDNKVDVVSSVYVFDTVEGQKLVADIPNFGKITVGYIKKVGKGHIVHVGVEPTVELIHAMLKHFKVDLDAHTSSKDVKTALFKRGKKSYLVAVNNGKEDKSAVVSFPGSGFQKKGIQAKDVSNGKILEFWGSPAPSLSIEMPPKDGRVFEIS